jgi:hypothetical protein
LTPFTKCGHRTRLRFEMSALADRQNPWLGLAAYGERECEFFFGRAAETTELLRLVEDEPLVVLYGVSGLGKTSLLQAGLFPGLRAHEFLPVLLRLHHDDEPTVTQHTEETIVCVERTARDADVKSPERADASVTLWEYFHRRDAQFWNSRNRLLTPVLVFDQFEEFFTLGGETERRRAQATEFFQQLSDLIYNRPPVPFRERLESGRIRASDFIFDPVPLRVVIALREDFLPQLSELRQGGFPTLLKSCLRLRPLSLEAARECIERPAPELLALSVAERLVRFLAGAETAPSAATESEVESLSGSESVEPALLSVVCRELNAERIRRGLPQINADLLNLSQEQILAEFYERSWESLATELRYFVEDELLTPGGFRDSRALDDALSHPGVTQHDIAQLIDRRILHYQDRQDGPRRIELTHDLLCRVVRVNRQLRKERDTARAAEEQRRREAEAATAREMELTRKTRRLRRICAGLAMLCVLILAGVWQHRQYYSVPYVAYYSGFTKRFGIPRGTGRLDESQIHHRRYSFQFTSLGKRGPLLRVEAVDSSGNLTHRHDVGTYLNPANKDESPNRECQWEFVLDTKGKVAYELAYDKYTNLVWALVYSPSTTEKPERLAHFVGPNGWPQPQKLSLADYVQIEYTTNGLERKLSYSDQHAKPQPGPEEAFAVMNGYDTNGMLIHVESLDAKGNLMLDGNWVAVTTNVFDRQGNVIECRYSDTENRPSLTKDGYAKTKMNYDDRGNCTNMVYFGTNGAPCLTKDGYARISAKYDERGNWTQLACFGIDGEPTFNRVGFAMLSAEWDDRGNWIKIILLDTEGKPTSAKELHAGVSAKYDERGNRIERVFLDKKGKPTLTKDGYAIIREKFDDHGNQIELAFFDVDGKPTTDQSNGIHKVKKTYDQRGRQTAGAYFGVDDKPILSKDGYAKFTVKHDRRANQVEWACFDTEEQPAIAKSTGAHMWREAHDDRDNCTNTIYFGTDGKATNTVVKVKYDDRSNQIEWACFDVDGKPTTDQSSGVHKSKKTYDPSGRQIAEAYFGVDDKPILSKDGYAKFAMKYDDRGNKIEWACFGADGKLALSKDGYATVKAKYDDRGNKIEWARFGADGKPSKGARGYALIVTTYNQQRNVVARKFYDADRQPVEVRPYIVEISPSDQGEKIELRPDDVILSYDGKEVWLSDDFNSMVLIPGTDSRKLKILRADRVLEVIVKPGQLPITVADRVMGSLTTNTK